MENAKKILLIDDEPNFRKSLKRIIKEELPHVEVAETGSGEEALDIIGNMYPDLILLDVLMPGMNGLTLLKKLKEDERKEIRDIPVIMLTGVGNREVTFNARKIGAADYVTKPFNDRILFLKIRSCLRK